MSEELKKTKTNLLDELESIKGLLLLDEHDIPVLEEAIDDYLADNTAPVVDDIFIAPDTPMNTPAAEQPSSNPFDEDLNDSLLAAPTNSQPAHTETASEKIEENPFLPKHIRSRLRGNRSPDTSMYNSNEETGTDITNLLVASIMPQLERLLRQRLSRLTKTQIDTLLNTNAQNSKDKN